MPRGAGHARPLPAGIDAAAAEQAAETRVHEALLEAVMSHQLPPGTRLVELPLCAAFGVTRSLLRRVFVRLANEKVIELHHNRGAVVAQASPEETRQVFEARRLIETALLRALPAPDRRAVDSLRALVDREEAAYVSREWSRLIRLSGEFHLQLAASFGNDELVSVLRGLVARTSLMIALYEMPGRGVCSFDEHRLILGALGKGDLAAAARHMAEHLEHCEMKLRSRPQPQEIDFGALFGGRAAAPDARQIARTTVKNADAGRSTTPSRRIRSARPDRTAATIAAPRAAKGPRAKRTPRRV